MFLPVKMLVLFIWFSVFTGVQRNEPDHCAEAEWPASSQSPFKVQQSQPAEEHSGFDRQPDQEPKPAQCHR